MGAYGFGELTPAELNALRPQLLLPPDQRRESYDQWMSLMKDMVSFSSVTRQKALAEIILPFAQLAAFTLIHGLTGFSAFASPPDEKDRVKFDYVLTPDLKEAARTSTRRTLVTTFDRDVTDWVRIKPGHELASRPSLPDHQNPDPVVALAGHHHILGAIKRTNDHHCRLFGSNHGAYPLPFGSVVPGVPALMPGDSFFYNAIRFALRIPVSGISDAHGRY